MRRSKVQIVTTHRFAHQSDFSQVRPGTTVRTAGHAHVDYFLIQAMRPEQQIHLVQQRRQVAFSFAEGLGAGVQGNAGQGMLAHRRLAMGHGQYPVFIQNGLHHRPFLRRNIADDEILVAGQPQVAVVDRSQYAQGRFQ